MAKGRLGCRWSAPACGSVGRQLCATCQQLLTRPGNAAPQPGAQETGSGCGKAARGGQGIAAQELPARGAAPRGAPGAAGKPTHPLAVPSCPSCWVGTAWEPPRRELGPYPVTLGAPRGGQWAGADATQPGLGYPAARRNGREQRGSLHDFSLAPPPTLRSELPWAGFSAEGWGEIKPAAHLDPARRFFLHGPSEDFLSSQHMEGGRVAHWGAHRRAFIYIFPFYVLNVTFSLDW